jgi:hypothetical protein
MPSLSLLLRDDDSAVRLSAISQRHGDGIGRINFEEVVDALSKRPRMQPPVQQLRRQNIGHLFDLIPGPRMPFHADAEGAQLFDPVPHSPTRHADLSSDFCPADNNHGVVGKQRKQRVDAAISRLRKSRVRHERFGCSSSTGTLACAVL